MRGELKPCPFCGGRAELLVKEFAISGCKAKAFVRCTECGAESDCYSENISYCANDRATEAWNRRVNDEI